MPHFSWVPAQFIVFLRKYDGNDWQSLVYKTASAQLREKAMKIQTMVLDEVSMIGMELFSFIDKRLRFLRKNNAHFGGIQAVIITGDFFQMSAIASTPLYINPDKVQDESNREAALLFRSFKFVQFKENCRQVQDDEFNDVLWALRTRNIKPSHIDFLKSRFEGRVSETERQNFRLSPRIFPTRALVKAYNNYSLIQQGKPVLKIVPVVFPKNARVENEYTLFLSDNVNVVLLDNVCVQLGLTNGSEGIFYKALYRKNYKSTSLPVVVLIYFPHYKGPCVYARNSTLPLVPIAPTTNSEYVKSENGKFTIKQFGICIRDAYTAHKCQGKTLNTGVICSGNRDYFFNEFYKIH